MEKLTCSVKSPVLIPRCSRARMHFCRWGVVGVTYDDLWDVRGVVAVGLRHTQAGHSVVDLGLDCFQSLKGLLGAGEAAPQGPLGCFGGGVEVSEHEVHLGLVPGYVV